ncbi:MAG TPA: hypothetical protein EYN66_19565 [Myxococcales bacterium]|nr:hypothetical protein [Myxococcales bacterium]
MNTLISIAARRWICIPSIVFTILSVAAVQHLLVLEIGFDLQRMFLPALVGAVVGWMLSSIAKLTLRAREQSNELEANKVKIEQLNASLEEALTHQIKARTEVERELIQAQRMGSVGHMAAGIAHDLNNVLTVILGSAELQQWGNAIDIPKRAGLIAHAAQKGAGLICRLMTFVRDQADEFGVVDLGYLVRDIQPLLKQLVGSKTPLETNIGDDNYTVMSSGVGLDQMVLNLVANARDAMKNREGSIRIRVHLSKGEVVLTVSDDGVGMEPKVLKLATQALYTTKAEGEGTGLGLSIVQRQLDSLGGRIQIDSEPDVGTVVQINLPHAVTDVASDSSDGPPSWTNGTESILIAENDVTIQFTLTSILEHAGYTVIRAPNIGAAREELVRQKPELVICSTALPGCNQWADSSAALPNTKVLLVASFTESIWPTDDLVLVHKPYSANQILRAVRQTLDDNPVTLKSESIA